MKRHIRWFILFLLATRAIPSGFVQLPKIFSSNMVLQRDMLIPVWGKADPGTSVTIELADNSLTIVAKSDGNWFVDLPDLPASGPYDMKISTPDTTIIFDNVMIGDVWLASGQSNMQWTVSNSNNADEEIADADYPNIRLFTVPRRVSGYPKWDIIQGHWQECSPQRISSFSAVAYYFGRELHKQKEVAIGLIHSSWGGTVAEAWTSAEMLKTMPRFKEEALNLLEQKPDYELLDEAQQAQKELYNELINNTTAGIKKGVHKIKYNDDNWKTCIVPGCWENDILPDYDGFVWFRKEIFLEKEYKNKNLELHLGKIRHFDVVYFNGQEVGQTRRDQVYRKYLIPGELVRAGNNVIAVRITNRYGEGGFVSIGDSLYLKAIGSEKVLNSLAGIWKCNETIEPELPKTVGYQNRASALYNAMIAPLVPFAIKGVIWYQGESNVSRAFQYQTLFPKMFEDWRVRWGQGYFPFLFVQLANYTDVLPEPAESDWAELREAQNLTLNYPHTGQVVIIDLGEADDIHPRNKQDVGKRLALAARKIAYGEDIVFSGPQYKNHEIKENKIIISFDNIGSGLMAKDGELTGFTIADKDKKFVWADAAIEGDQIIVTHPEISNPVAVRYAWANNPVCNLYNKEGLPASPFRTDDWQGITEK